MIKTLHKLLTTPGVGETLKLILARLFFDVKRHGKFGFLVGVVESVLGLDVGRVRPAGDLGVHVELDLEPDGDPRGGVVLLASKLLGQEGEVGKWDALWRVHHAVVVGVCIFVFL